MHAGEEMKLLKQVWPELLACCLAFTSLAISCHNHHRIQERLNELEIIDIPEYPPPHFEHVPEVAR